MRGQRRSSCWLLLPCCTTVITAQLADRNRFNIHKQEQQQQRVPLTGQRDSSRTRQSGPLRLPSLSAPWEEDSTNAVADDKDDRRSLSSQLSGCCYNFQKYDASDLCALYGQDCDSGQSPSHDSGDASCSLKGLSFIGLSFSVNTVSGNPYSYQLCDQFPMENIIDRDYKYVMSMDEDGWLVGGGYKTFDYSGKMPYVTGVVLKNSTLSSNFPHMYYCHAFLQLH
jgi:hypothetical protein